MKKILTLFLAAALLCGVLCGCKGASKKEDGSASGKDTSTGAADNSIVVGIAQDLDSSLDPYSITAAGTREVLFNVYEGLVKADHTGTYQAACASDFSVSDDGLTYTFLLRDNVVFHNGATMTVDDVLYSFETCAAKTVDASLSAALSDAVVASPDPKTVTVTLPAPNPSFIAFVAYVYIVPANAAGLETQPVGTGPFKFVSRSVQQNVILEKHDKYYGTPAYLDRVTYRVFEDASAEITALDAGTIDICAHLLADQIAGLSSDYNVMEGTMNLVQALYLNNAKEPFSNELVRKALCYAIDEQEIMDLTEDGHGTPVGSAMYPAFTKYFDASLADTYPHDTAKAKELLAQAGYPNGFAMTITVPSNYTPHVNTAEVIVEQLKAVGITAKVDKVEWATWLSDVYKGRSFESTVVGFDASTLTAAAMLSRYQSDASNNMFNYASAEFDAAYAKATAATDDAEATALYKECLKILADTAANVYIQDLCEFVVIRKGLTGYRFYPMYVMDMSTVRYE
ncbi:MAG: ABC transporter substrate-binding protein [Oscillospiraceae bacterium]|nr:ABC transporter substrate-binding protein [Oscillospiraceae bacterium]